MKPRTPLRRSLIARKRGTPRKRMWVCAHCRIKNDPAKKKCQGCGIGRATKRASLKARADAMARKLCRLLAGGRCARCGMAGSDWAHRFPRRHHSLRWSMDNCDFLCRECHRYFTDRPLAFSRWLTDRIGYDRARALEARANSPWDRDYVRVIADLSTQLARLRDAA